MKFNRTDCTLLGPPEITRRSLLELASLALTAAVFPSPGASAGRRDRQAKATQAVGSVMNALSTYMSEAAKHSLPDEVREKTKHHILDTLAAMISGSNLIPGQRALQFARAYGGKESSTVVASNILCDRFIPRLKSADSRSLLNDAGDNLDPARVWDVLMRDEKPGGHGERSVAVGVVDMAVWDAVAKIAGVPLYRLLADRYRGGAADTKVFVYAAGGYYYPGKDLAALQNEMSGYLDLGYSVVKMKIGGAPLSEDLRRIVVARWESELSRGTLPRNLAEEASGQR